jgi:hypothetical protein
MQAIRKAFGDGCGDGSLSVEPMSMLDLRDFRLLVARVGATVKASGILSLAELNWEPGKLAVAPNSWVWSSLSTRCWGGCVDRASSGRYSRSIDSVRPFLSMVQE